MVPGLIGTMDRIGWGSHFSSATTLPMYPVPEETDLPKDLDGVPSSTCLTKL